MIALAIIALVIVGAIACAIACAWFARSVGMDE